MEVLWLLIGISLVLVVMWVVIFWFGTDHGWFSDADKHASMILFDDQLLNPPDDELPPDEEQAQN